uniref:Putative dna-directed rna polymerase i subunit rpa49 n=1 Tax=Xenopsylla cheopis TaxID=163159 RepID=A0A6M2DJV2_XENCH
MSRISEVHIKRDGILPVLINFENGTLSTNMAHSKLQCEMLSDTSTTVDHIITESNNMLYKGAVETFMSTFTMLAIKNKKTNKIRLIEINKCNLAPILKDSLDMNLEHKSKKEMLSILNKTFGSKRTKRRTEIREHMAINVEEVKEQLEKTIQKTVVANEDLKEPSVGDSLDKLMPPIHRDATSVDRLYVLEELVDLEIVQSLSSVADEFLNTKIEKYSFSAFVEDKLLSLKNSDVTTKNMDCCVLLYIDSLINYLTANYRELAKKNFAPCPHSSAVSKYILNTFSMPSANGRTRPNSMRDKTIAYIIVLSLLTCGHIVLVENIAKSLKVSRKKVDDIANAIGVSQSKIDGESVLVLKLPLPKVNASFFRGKKKKGK